MPWLALLHDLGKPSTRTVETAGGDEHEPVNRGSGDGLQRIRFFGHEEAGAKLAKVLLTEMRFSSDEVRLGKVVTRAHMRPHHLHQSFDGHSISRRACYRFFRDIGYDSAGRPYGIDVILLAMADRLSIGDGLSKDDLLPAVQDEWQGYLAHMHQLLAFAFHRAGLDAVRADPLVDGTLLIERFDLQPGPIVGQLLAYLAEAQAAGEVQTEQDALDLAARWLEST